MIHFSNNILKKIRTAFLLALVLSNTLFLMGQAKPKGIIFVMTDDQGYGDIDYFYPSTLETPALDALAAESIRLTDFHTGTTCAPTRASLMTGRHINATGVWHTITGRELLRENEQTIAEVFQANDWNTGIFGKWHLGDGYPFSPRFRGFDLAVIHGAGGIGQGPDYWQNDYYTGIDGDGNSTTSDFYFENGTPVEADRFCTDYFFERAKEFIQESVNKDEPFFCYIPTNAPHSPFNAPFGGKSGFDGLVENIDDNMAALDAYLEEMGIKDDVLLVFTTDNGTAGNRSGGLRGKKGSQYDGGHNVPSLVRWKNGGMAGSVETSRDETSLTAAMDFFPTFMELCELDKPAGGQPIHGYDLTERLLNPNFIPSKRNVVVDNQRGDDLIKWKQACVMQDQIESGVIIHKWRLIRNSFNSSFELYDFLVDRDTDNDLAESYPEVVSELSDNYEDWYDIISENAEPYSPFVVNDDFEDELVLHAHSWIKAGTTPWHQNSIISGRDGSGVSAIRFDKGGTYNFELRRWPREDGGAIDAVSNLAGGTAITAAQARITIQNVGEVTVPVESGATAVFIQMEVPAGEATEITTSFLDNTGSITKGVYYVYISLLKEEVSSPLVAYTDCDYGGTAYTFDEGTYDYKDGSFLNDVISSIKVKEGYEVEVLEHAFREGKSIIFQASEIACLEDTGLNEKISGIIVRKSPNVATIYENCNYDGISVPLEIGEYSRLTDLGLQNDIISSVKVPKGLRVTLWEHANFRGSSITFTEDDICLVDNKFNDIAGSAIIAPEEIDLFVWAGQSNAQGWKGDGAQYPVDTYNLDSLIPLNWTYINNYSSNDWETMEPQTGRYELGHFGPEVSFSRNLKQEGYNPAIFKYTLGGTSIYENWLTPGAGGYYDDMITDLDKAIEQLEADGYVVNVEGFVWIQGESDSKDDAAASAYYNNLTSIIKDIRRYIGNDALPIILGVDEQNPNVVGNQEVLNAQLAIANEDSHINFTSMLGLEKSDQTHLTPAALVSYGEIIFDSMLCLLTSGLSSSCSSSKAISAVSKSNISPKTIVYPNPSSEYVDINTNNATQVQKVFIYDLSGRVIETIAINYKLIRNNTFSIPIAQLEQGMYVLQLEFVSGEVESHNLIVK